MVSGIECCIRGKSLTLEKEEMVLHTGNSVLANAFGPPVGMHTATLEPAKPGAEVSNIALWFGECCFSFLFPFSLFSFFSFSPSLCSSCRQTPRQRTTQKQRFLADRPSGGANGVTIVRNTTTSVGGLTPRKSASPQSERSPADASPLPNPRWDCSAPVYVRCRERGGFSAHAEEPISYTGPGVRPASHPQFSRFPALSWLSARSADPWGFGYLSPRQPCMGAPRQLPSLVPCSRLLLL